MVFGHLPFRQGPLCNHTAPTVVAIHKMGLPLCLCQPEIPEVVDVPVFSFALLSPPMRAGFLFLTRDVEGVAKRRPAEVNDSPGDCQSRRRDRTAVRTSPTRLIAFALYFFGRLEIIYNSLIDFVHKGDILIIEIRYQIYFI